MKRQGSRRKSYPFIKVYLDIVKCAEFQKLLQIPVYGMQAAYLYIRLALYTTNNGGVLTERIGEEEIDLSASDLVQIVNAAGADLATVNMLVNSLKQCHLLYQNSFGHLAVTGFCYTGDPAEPSLHNAERPDEVVRPLGNWMEAIDRRVIAAGFREKAIAGGILSIPEYSEAEVMTYGEIVAAIGLPRRTVIDHILKLSKKHPDAVITVNSRIKKFRKCYLDELKETFAQLPPESCRSSAYAEQSEANAENMHEYAEYGNPPMHRPSPAHVSPNAQKNKRTPEEKEDDGELDLQYLYSIALDFPIKANEKALLAGMLKEYGKDRVLEGLKAIRAWENNPAYDPVQNPVTSIAYLKTVLKRTEKTAAKRIETSRDITDLISRIAEDACCSRTVLGKILELLKPYWSDEELIAAVRECCIFQKELNRENIEDSLRHPEGAGRP
ncbi:MAG: hypothetical protein SOW94_11685 [Erysipelotrichaceae bacterium]|nr:hypothetical protein [Erysipelotrichaceae bacterium]